MVSGQLNKQVFAKEFFLQDKQVKLQGLQTSASQSKNKYGGHDKHLF